MEKEEYLKVSTPKISIITIVYNNVRDIEYTILSVLKQTYTNIEYIIIDGKSSDGTLARIEKYSSNISILVSEKDKGIYDAMNKGLALATGEYVLFLNSGDELYDEKTLQIVIEKGENADIIYGETKLIDEKRNVLGDRRHKAPAQFSWKSFQYGMNICHQAIYVKRIITAPYNTKYQLSADIDWVIEAAKKARTTQNVHTYVARYLVGGMSQKRHQQSLKERFDIFKTHYGTFRNWFNHGIIAMRLIVYRIKNGKTRE